ncbi:MAG TPA: SxtJ family membrane protein [Syntrophorhabdaceae bacterium]|nr:SxtJ family membrane protein [Syntrophorhabdaceae bacterium]HOL04732.1 SxtJ family membrane protein [Syntrophorhabdaceae bacterium]
MIDKEKSPDLTALETIAVLAFVSVAIGLFFKIKSLLYVALCLLFIGIFLKAISIRIAKAWLRFSSILGGISTRVVLTIIYFIFLTPIAFVYRLSHGDFLTLKRKDSKGVNYWEERNYEYSPKDFENPW